VTGAPAKGLADLRGDYRFQADFVVDAAWRLLAMQDDTPLSPSFGCFHYSYWRDKTSEFPDARFQEAGATLGLLSLPYFDDARRTGRLAPTGQLYRAFAAGLRNLAQQQYPEGCYDEWYKGERGFAATEFTTIAYGLAGRFLGDRLAPEDRRRLQDVLARAGRWLARHDDRVKANHEAAAAAALALTWEVTGDASFKAAARAKLENTLRRQHGEGWFPEIGGMDLGYCSVLLDYVMIYTLVTGDGSGLPAMSRLFSFILPLIHPNGTISAEMGLCLNPYVSRLGIGLLSAHDAAAQVLVAFFQSATSSMKGLRPYLADDLRLTRWSHLPLVTGLVADAFRAAPGDVKAFAKSLPSGWTWYRSAAVCAYHGDGLGVYFSPAGGGVVRIYQESCLIYEDIGLELDTSDGRFVSTGYDPERLVTATRSGFAVSCHLGQTRFFYPSFLARLVLRLGSSTSFGSRFLRALIDHVRLRRRTAANQSAAPMADRGSPYRLERTVEVEGTMVRIIDRLESGQGTINPDSVTLLVKVADETLSSPSVGAPARQLAFVKTCDVSGASPVFSWCIEPMLANGAGH